MRAADWGVLVLARAGKGSGHFISAPAACPPPQQVEWYVPQAEWVGLER